MTDNNDLWTRRHAIRIGAGAGAALALGKLPLNALASASSRGIGSQGSELLTKPIPSSGEQIPLVGIGTARRFDVGESAEERAGLKEVLRLLPELGGKLVDTAPSYGRAEPVVGDLVAEIGNRDRLFIATKVRVREGAPAAGIAEMEQSFRQLRTNGIDLMQVHNLASVYEMLPVIREWKQEGRIRYVGVSTSSDRQYPDFIAMMEKEDLDFIQVDYSIANRTAAERILPLAADRGMAVLVNLPYGRGRTFQAVAGHEMPEWAAEIDCATWGQFFLKYIVSHPAVTCAIPGTYTVAYLEDNLGAALGRLPDAEMRARMEQFFDDV